MKPWLVLLLVACKSDQPAPAPAPPPKPALSSVIDETWLGELPAPADAKPIGVGGPVRMHGKYPATLGGHAVDERGEIFVIDGGYRDADVPEVVAIPPLNGELGSAPRVVMRTAALPGGEREELFDIAVDNTDVYVTSNVRNFDGSKIAYAVRVVPKSGGVARVLLRGTLEANGLLLRMVADREALYLVRSGDGGTTTLVRKPKRGGGPVELARDLGGFYAIAVDDVHVYYDVKVGPGHEHHLVRVPKLGGAPEKVADSPDAIGMIAVDGHYVYFTVYVESLLTIQRVPKAGGAPVEVARFDGFSNGAAVDRGIVYWAVLGETHAAIHARDASKPVLGEARDTGKTVLRGPTWSVVRGTLYSPLTNTVDRIPL